MPSAAVRAESSFERMNALQPGSLDRGIGCQPRAGCGFRRLMVRQDGPHDFALASCREHEIAQQPGNVGTMLGITCPGKGQYRSAAVVRAEGSVSAAEVSQVELHVHG